MFNPLATFVAGQPAALLLFSGSLLWLWASPRTHRWRSFRFVCEKTSLERGTFAGLLQVQSQACANLACTLDEQSCWESYSFFFTTCMHLFGLGNVSKSGQMTSQHHPNDPMQLHRISVDHCVQNLRWLLLIIHPRKLLRQKIRTFASSWSKLYRF